MTFNHILYYFMSTNFVPYIHLLPYLLLFLSTFSANCASLAHASYVSLFPLYLHPTHLSLHACLFHFQDMTARDLLQQRYTLPNGDTAWRPSPLVTAAIEGKLLLLDGIHRVNLGTLAVLSRYFNFLNIFYKLLLLLCCLTEG